MKPKKKSKVPAEKLAKHGYNYVQLWKIIDGAVFDALKMHPEYLTDRGHRNARLSIVKRVTGAVLGYVTETSVAKGRSGEKPAAKSGNGLVKAIPQADGASRQ